MDLERQPLIQKVGQLKGQIAEAVAPAGQAEWMPDSQTTNCNNCYKVFTIINRRHHCRLCGKIFCNTCSKKTTTRINEGDLVTVRLCNNCNHINNDFNQTLDRNQPLLLNQLKNREDGQFQHLSPKNTSGNMKFSEVDFSSKNQPQQDFSVYNHDTSYQFVDYSTSFQVTTEEVTQRLSIAKKSERQTLIKDMSSMVAEKSNQHQHAIQKYLKMNHYSSDTSNPPSGGQLSSNNLNISQSSAIFNNGFSNLESRNSTKLDQMFESHLENMVSIIIRESEIDTKKWKSIIYAFVRQVVMTVRPTSVILNDSIDINKFVKIVTVEYPNQDKCRFVHGIVFKKDVGLKLMRNNIETPRILLLANSLGYVQDDAIALTDLEQEINQEADFVKMIRNKISLVKPDVIFVEKDASRLILEILRTDNITVATNTSPKMLAMIARCTQTIICPNSNFISKNFKEGKCGQFKIEQLKGADAFSDKTRQITSLLCLEGCRAELGCSIVLSGSDIAELKVVRDALRKCVKTARMLFHEREYFRFLRPSLTMPVESQNEIEVETLNQSGKDTDQHQDNRFSVNHQSKDDPFQINPFLFEKLMARQSLIFEHFSLAYPLKANTDIDDANQLKSQEIKRKNTDNNISGLPLDDPKLQNETEIKRKLKKMCMKPKRVLVNFYSEQNDVSVFSMVKHFAKTANSVCQADGCGKQRISHTDYWYHNNGSVEIKFIEDSQSQLLSIQKQIDQASEVLIYVYCNKCESLVIKKQAAPIEFLEMSFYRLLEQFIYNQDIQTINFNSKSVSCMHSFHRDCCLIMRFGPVKIMINFERIEEYTLDMIHFGTTPGIFCAAEIQEKVQLETLQSVEQFSLAIKWIIDQSRKLTSWLNLAAEEVNNFISSPEIKPIVLSMISFIQNLSESVINFNESINPKQKNQLQANEDQTQLQQNTLPVKKFSDTANQSKSKNELETNNIQIQALIVKLKLPTQGARIQKLMAERICEFLFLLRKSQQFICTEMFQKFIGKKTLQQFLQPPEKFDHNDSFVNTQETKIGFSANPALMNQMLNAANSSRTESPSLSVKQHENERKMTVQLMKDDVRLGTLDVPETKTTLNQTQVFNQHAPIGPSVYLRLQFKEVLEFESSLLANEAIRQITQHSALMPLGYNKAGIRVKPYDFTSLIAMTLGSNLYLNGLATLDYMQMKEKLVTFTKASDQMGVTRNEDQITIDQKDQKNVTFSSGQNVLDEHVPFSLAEAELSKITDSCMYMQFSTMQKAEMSLEQGGLENLVFSEKNGNVKTFYSQNEPILDLGQLDRPVPEFLFKQLSQIISQSLKVVKQSNPYSQNQLLSSTMQNLNSRSTLGQSLPTPNPVDDIPTINLNVDQAKIEIYHLFHEQLEFSIKVYFPGHFEALRKIYCGNYTDFIQSFVESNYWKDNSGGKSRSTFFMSSDKKYVLKAVKSNEVKMFEEMSGSYFLYLQDSFARQCPTCIAKTLGIFKIKLKTSSKPRGEQYYLLLMENLLLHIDEQNSILYDLKGSRRNRFIPNQKTGQVTLDNNYLQDMKSKPIPLQYSMKRLISIAIQNDSLYLSKHSIIDYSMFVIINPIRKTVRLGIIDYVQQYTIDKELESYLKQTLSSEEPTIIPPDSYRHRFRTAMDKYFVAMIPDRDSNVNNLMRNVFNADKIKWFTKAIDENQMV